MACPTWKNYVNTEEACDIPANDGDIFFVTPDFITHPSTTFYLYGTVVLGDPENSDAVDGNGTGVWVSTTLPNEELGVWSYVFLGTMNGQINNENFNDIFTVYYADNNPGFMFPFTHESIEYVSQTYIDIKNEVGADINNILVSAWTGDLEIYFTLNEIQYGPLIISSTRTVYM